MQSKQLHIRDLKKERLFSNSATFVHVHDLSKSRVFSTFLIVMLIILILTIIIITRAPGELESRFRPVKSL